MNFKLFYTLQEMYNSASYQLISSFFALGNNYTNAY